MRVCRSAQSTKLGVSRCAAASPYGRRLRAVREISLAGVEAIDATVGGSLSQRVEGGAYSRSRNAAGHFGRKTDCGGNGVQLGIAARLRPGKRPPPSKRVKGAKKLTPSAAQPPLKRSKERRVGKEGGSKCKNRG